MGNFSSNESKEDEKANDLERSNPKSKSAQNEVKIEGGSASSAVKESLKPRNQYKETRRTNNNGYAISLHDSM